MVKDVFRDLFFEGLVIIYRCAKDGAGGVVFLSRDATMGNFFTTVSFRSPITRRV
jgi:hypothetical protein